ncbi:LysR family transcriptional regulator [Pseudorhodoplanes sp.]|uniref:LysR family transcriptional regulator n=1 Tax=Pseudorhodoplanes sp. TaxID=1934341 RepID=UPI003D12146E
MTLTQVRVFWMVASMNSVSEAARALSLTASAVLMHLRALEKDLGVDLYERGHRGAVVLTAGGNVFMSHANLILQEADQAQRELSNFRKSATGRLRIGANTTGGMYVLPEIVRRYKELMPDLDVQPTFESTPKIVDLLLHGILDVALTGGPMGSERYEVRSVGADELVLIASPDHRMAVAGSAQLSDLFNVDLVLPGVGSRTRWLLDSTLSQAGLRIRTALTMNGTEDVKRAVMSNVGVGFVSMYSVLCEVAAGSLVVIVMPGFRIKRDYELFWRKGYDMPQLLGPLEQVARVALDELKKRAAQVLPSTI